MKKKKKKVSMVVEHLIRYDNKKKLSWTNVYKEVLKELNLKDDDQNILVKTVKELTNLGYDIIGDPFKLEKFR